MSAAVGNKRKRGVSSNNNNCGINNLTGEILSSIATYLPKTSRALLAVSLMKNNYEPRTASKAIISSVNDNAPYELLTDDLFSLISRALSAVSLMQNNEPSTASKAIISSVKDNAPYESLMDDLLSEFECETRSARNRDIHEPKSYKHYTSFLRKELHINLVYATLAEGKTNGLVQQMSTYYDGGWEILDFVDIPKSLASRLTAKI